MNARCLSVTRAALFMSLAAVLACGQAPTDASDMGGVPGAGLERDGDALFQTDSLSYTVVSGDNGYWVHIATTFTNRTGHDVYFANCNNQTGLKLEKLEDGEWRTAWSPMLPLCLSAPILVEPGSTYDMDVGVFGGYPDNNKYPKFLVDEVDGVYRIVWDAAYSFYEKDGESNEELPLGQRVSNRFVMTVEGR